MRVIIQLLESVYTSNNFYPFTNHSNKIFFDLFGNYIFENKELIIRDEHLEQIRSGEMSFDDYLEEYNREFCDTKMELIGDIYNDVLDYDIENNNKCLNLIREKIEA